MGAAESTACCVASRGDKGDADGKSSKNSSLVPEKVDLQPLPPSSPTSLANISPNYSNRESPSSTTA